MANMNKILDIQFTSSNIVKNSTELKLNTPLNSPNAHIYSKSMIGLESHTLTKNVQKTLTCISFDQENKEYIRLSNDITIKTPDISICFWIYMNDTLGSNTAILDFTHKDKDGKFSNKIIIKKITTKDRENKIVFMVNNTSVLLSVIPKKWTHYCWVLKSDSTNNNFTNWKITVNGNDDSASSFSNKVFFDKTVVLNNNLIGKSDSEPALLGFDGKLTGITIYDAAIDPNLDIYNDDPTVKYMMFSPAEGFVSSISSGVGGVGDTYNNNLYDDGMGGDVSMTDFMDSISRNDNIEDVGGMDGENNMIRPTAIYQQLSNNLDFGYVEYENMGLGIFFICMTIIIYKYF